MKLKKNMHCCLTLSYKHASNAKQLMQCLMEIPNFLYSGKPGLITFGCQYECCGLVFSRIYINVCVYDLGNNS